MDLEAWDGKSDQERRWIYRRIREDAKYKKYSLRTYYEEAVLYIQKINLFYGMSVTHVDIYACIQDQKFP